MRPRLIPERKCGTSVLTVMTEKELLFKEGELDDERRNLEKFAFWMLQSGHSALEYELVEETRAGGIRLWYFRKRAEAQYIQGPSPSGPN